jgi:hypothetical protein
MTLQVVLQACKARTCDCIDHLVPRYLRHACAQAWRQSAGTRSAMNQRKVEEVQGGGPERFVFHLGKQVEFIVTRLTSVFFQWFA